MARLLLGLSLALAAIETVVPRFFVSGFLHIVPHGLDHILFILGLFFLSRNFSTLLFEMTLFTFAHSLTLGLSLFGFVSLPMTFVEVTIALSITFIAIENLWSLQRLKPWRPWVIFGFGLIHGLGFAHSFAETSVAPEDFLPALFSFNLGIELGQLAVIGTAFAFTALLRKQDRHTASFARPACICIAATGIYMAIQRGI